MQIAPMQIDKIVPQFVERQVIAGYEVCGRPPEPSRARPGVNMQIAPLIRQVPSENMQIAPKQIEKYVPQFVERQEGVASTPRVPG